MLRYEEKIRRFARDKHFLRLSRPVRGRADGLCDACGSTRPRTLYGLSDVATGRHYFVGDSCLKELVKQGAILRRFGKESGKQAYEDEMKLRAGTADDGSGPEDGLGDGSGDVDGSVSKPFPFGSTGPAPTADTISSQVFMFEIQKHYHCFVVLICGGAGHAGFGTACVAKYEEAWSAGGVSGWVLENLKLERPDAPIRCLAQAWQEAYAQLEGKGANIAPLSSGFHGSQIRIKLFQPGDLRSGLPPAVEARHGL